MTTIEWTNETWNPVRGCSRVSAGCDNCYAMRQARRQDVPGGAYEGLTRIGKRGVDWAGMARLAPDQLEAPLRWRRPRRIFVNSMSDLFHDSLSDSAIDAVFGVMWACLYVGRDARSGHVFQVLTKRPERAREYFAKDRRRAWADAAVHRGGGIDPDGIHDQVMFHKGPHPRIWLGVSVEDQATADERIPMLLELPAAVRFISAEPLLGDLTIWAYLKGETRDKCLATLGGEPLPGLDWVIVGGESGNGSRPFQLAWARSLVEQCKAARVACFVKQLGARPSIPEADWRADADAGGFTLISPKGRHPSVEGAGLVQLALQSRKGGDMSEWPAELQVRQFPTTPTEQAIGAEGAQAMTEPALETREPIFDVPVDDIIPSRLVNYRKKYNEAKLDELAASMREAGVLSPLVVRRSSIGTLELVFGYRRLAAAARAGLASLPCVVRDYDDAQVREARLIENGQREDADPLDEAEAFLELVDSGYTEEQVAVKTGKTLRYVRERLALNRLCVEAGQALAEGKILLDVALVIAALPAGQTQRLALEECTSLYSDEIMTAAGARHAIARRVLLQLSEAPFKLDDAELVPQAGPCTTCPQRTGHQGNLFGQTEKDDHCLDPACHRSKVDALYQLRVKQAKTDGQEVLSKKASAEALQGAHHYGRGPLVMLDEELFLGGGGRRKKLRSLFVKELPPITIAKDEASGAPVELVPREAAERAIKAASPQAAKSPAGSAKAKDGKLAKEREAERLQAEVRKRVLVGLVEATEDHGAPQPNDEGLELLRVLALCAINTARPDVRKAVANRRGCPLTVEEGEATSKRGKGKRQEQLAPEERLQRLLPSLDSAQLTGLLLELLVSAGAPGKWAEAHDSYVKACEVLHVSVAVIEGNLKAERKIKADEKAKGKPPKADRPTGWTEGSVKKKPKKKPKTAPAGVTHFAADNATGTACGKKLVIRVGEGSTNGPAGVTCPGCKPFAEEAAAKAAPKEKTPRKRKAKAPPAPPVPVEDEDGDEPDGEDDDA